MFMGIPLNNEDSLKLKLTGCDAECGGNFLAGGLARLGDCFLLSKRRLRNAHALGDFFLSQIEMFAPGADGCRAVNHSADHFMRNH